MKMKQARSLRKQISEESKRNSRAGSRRRIRENSKSALSDESDWELLELVQSKSLFAVISKEQREISNLYW